VVPQLPQNGKLREIMLLIIAIVGTKVALWPLFFQQSYVIDKHITPRFMALSGCRSLDRHPAHDNRRRRDDGVQRRDLLGPSRVRQFPGRRGGSPPASATMSGMRPRCSSPLQLSTPA
jgi:hypothetical protein